MGQLTWLTAALRRVRERPDVTNEVSAAREEQHTPDPVSSNELHDRLTDRAHKARLSRELRDAESERRIREDQAFTRTAIQRFLVATLCIVVVILAVAFLCYTARGIHLSIPKSVAVALGVAAATAVSAVGVALGRFLRGTRGGRSEGD
jgi:hypothetical protein